VVAEDCAVESGSECDDCCQAVGVPVECKGDGDGGRAYVSATLLQPFVSYITKTKTTFGLNLESTYDWRGAQWSVPVNFTVQQLLKVGKLPVQIGVGVRYWAESPNNGPEGWGARLQLTFLLPK
jgi:hypothetical protein